MGVGSHVSRGLKPGVSVETRVGRRGGNVLITGMTIAEANARVHEAGKA